jgi:photosystem II stability/assembly factor-like uncharacterized protein
MAAILAQSDFVQSASPWKVQPSGTNRALFAIACPTAVQCYAVGAFGTIRATRNGGSRWRGQGNPLGGSSVALSRVACPGPNTCYVVELPDKVLVTRNGGVTWVSHTLTLSSPKASLTDVACIGTSVCYLVAQPNAVYLTTNGGSTWALQSIPPTVPCQGSCGSPNISYSLEWVFCLPSHLCRAGGTKFVGSHEGFADAVIQTTTVGASWTMLTHGFSPAAAVCTTASRCYGLYSSPFDPGNKVWFSTDAGVSWQSRPSGTARFRNGIACPAPRTCYTVGNVGTITWTTNGAPFVSQASPTIRNLNGIACIKVNVCFAVGNKGTIVARKG